MLCEGGNQMKILVVEPGCKPVTMEIDGTLKTMQNLVGGYIQAIYPFREEVALICNEEGRLLGLPMNRGLRDEKGNPYEIICGTFLICGISGEDFASLSDEQLQHYAEVYATPEIFLNLGGRIIILPMQVETEKENV